MTNTFTFINSIEEAYEAYVNEDGILMIFDEATCSWEQAGAWDEINGSWTDNSTFVEGY